MHSWTTTYILGAAIAVALLVIVVNLVLNLASGVVIPECTLNGC